VADSVTVRRVPRSQASFTEARVHDPFAVADWRPRTHPTMPAIVARGRKPAVFACAYCHLPDGSGRPGNAMLAGLPAAYIVQQVADMKSRARRSAWPAPYVPSDDMRRIADSATDEEVAVAARYFSGLVPRQRSQVVEATEIPQAVPSLGLYVPVAHGGHEPLGRRLVEMPADVSRHELRDPWVGYVAYVPPGSIARGRGLATTGALPGVPACESCHGPGLRGAGPVPPLAGRPPSYLLRQLFAFRTGTRSTPASAPMRAVAAMLEFDDMVAAAAYAGSRKP
jgi:cytochrome c553